MALSRRKLLVQSISSSALLGLHGCNVTPSKGRPSINVGAHIWVYAKHQPNYDVSNILGKIWSDFDYAGIQGVELMEHPLRRTDTTKEIKSLIEEYNLPLIGTSYGAKFWDRNDHNKIYEDLANIFSNMKELQARTIGISVKPADGNRKKTEKELDDQAALIVRVRKMAMENGVVLNLHNHTYEVENNLHDLLGTLKRIPDINLGPDLNWLKRAGIDPHWFLREFKNNIVFLHIRDQYKSGKWSESLGEGDVDFWKISNTLSDINFKGDLMIELAHEDGFEPTRPIRESLKMSRDVVNQAFGV